MTKSGDFLGSEGGRIVSGGGEGSVFVGAEVVMAASAAVVVGVGTSINTDVSVVTSRFPIKF